MKAGMGRHVGSSETIKLNLVVSLIISVIYGIFYSQISVVSLLITGRQ